MTRSAVGEQMRDVDGTGPPYDLLTRGSGACRKQRVGEWVRLDGPATTLKRSYAAYLLAMHTGLDVVPRCELQADEAGGLFLQRQWVEGWDGCGFEDIMTDRGARIALLDFLTFNRDRTLHSNVIRASIDRRLWAIDHEHCFEPARTVAGREWELGGGSAFVHLWSRPSLWHDYAAGRTMRRLWIQASGGLSTWFDTPTVCELLPTDSRREAQQRVKCVDEGGGDLGKAWIAWRDYMTTASSTSVEPTV